jgi:transposase-like protein
VRKFGVPPEDEGNDVPQNASRHLSPAQDLAADALVAGASVTDAAEIASVDRSTVHRWLRQPAFQATVNARRADLRQAQAARLEALAERAIDRLARAIDEDENLDAATTLLKGLGLLSGRTHPLGSTDPDVLAAEAAAVRPNDLEVLMFRLDGRRSD